MPALYLVLKILHFLGLGMGVGASFALFTLGLASVGLEPTERRAFMLRAGAVSKNGSYGFLLLVLSGLGMFFMRGPASVLAAGGPPFHAKLTFVVIMAGVLGYSQVLRKRARTGDAKSMDALRKVGGVLLALSIAIVIAAVIAFQ